LRPLGRSAVGLSVGLKGNGMCFSASIIDRFAWNWFTLAEDVELHLALVEHGIRVEFAHDTWVKGDMPVTLDEARSQNQRWERGRLQLVKQHVPRLIWHGLRKRRWLQIDAAVEQLTPPLSVPVAIAVLAAPAAYLLGSPGLAAIAGACLAGYALYLFAALVLVRAPLRIYLSLLSAPAYMGWKLGLYGQSLVTLQSTTWVRTTRRPQAR
jgi:1,2-diacylglycerol 3-beta-glucosyltransferase